MDFLILVFAVALVTLWLSTETGAYLCRTRGRMEEDERAALGVILTAALTLLALIIGWDVLQAGHPPPIYSNGRATRLCRGRRCCPSE